jgi:tetratricopeptide (TPR) repeat protein
LCDGVVIPEDGPQRLGNRFIIERRVGGGGGGVVYRAYDLVTTRTVALKVMESDAGATVEDAARWAREGQLLSELDHPGIVKIVAHGVLEDTGAMPYLAMEWLEGEDLAARQRRAPLEVPCCVELAMFVAMALQAAHDAGVVHRDIKPGNVFLCVGPNSDADYLDVFPKLVDFGVAARENIRITRTGDVVGTPAYMAPEQIRSDASVDGRSDIYSLGAMLFELICGRPPHVGATPIATLARMVTTPAPRLREFRQDLPRALDELVARMLQTDPVERPQSAREVAETLHATLDVVGRLSSLEPVDLSSLRLGSSASRLVTTIVALRLAPGSARERTLEQLRTRGADCVPLGPDALVAHLGARRAVGTEATVALDLARRLARAGAQVGIATGRARVNFRSQTGEVWPVGEVVDRAAALAREASTGVVIADVTTSELGRGRYEFRSRGDGSAIVGEPVRGARREAPGGAPFVGRDPELAQISAALQRSSREQTPVLVSITGPPGIGKTRLRHEVLARISAQAEAPDIVFQRSEAYARGHALGTAADILRAVVGLPKGGSASEAERAIVARLGPQTREELTTGNRDLLARLLVNEPLPEGYDPRGARDALWLAMTDLLLQVVDSPTVLVCEDVQWADPESIGFLDHMLGRAAHKPLLLLVMARPSFWTDHPRRFQGRDHVRVELRPLSLGASKAIASAMLGQHADPEVVERIAVQAAGLPLFAEELSRLSAAGRASEHAPTIEAAIQVSLDALDEECRDAVGRLSVLGQTCWDAALEALGIPGAEGIMRDLAAAEVLIEQNVPRLTGTREWMFKHALVREVAYNSLGEPERRELHALAADWLASMGEDAVTVAGHYDLGDQPTRAAEHWARAARHALAANALSDAVQMAERSLMFADDKVTAFERACLLDEAWGRLDPRSGERDTAVLALQDNVHDERSSVRARGSRARYDDARGTGDDVSERLSAVRDQAAALGMHDEEARCSAVLASRLAYAGQFEQAEAEAERLLQLASNHGLAAAAVDAWAVLAIVQQTRGALIGALEARRNAANAARAAGLRERQAMLTTNVGFALTTIGARQEARSALLQGLALADALGSAGAVRHAQMNLLGWAATFGRDKEIDLHLGEIRAEADLMAGGGWAAPDRSSLGVLFYRGCELLRAHSDTSSARARSLVRTAARGYGAAGFRDVLPVALGMWAEAERRCEQPGRSVQLAQEAVELLESGAPSLLNESVVFLALHDAQVELGDEEGARQTITRALPHVLRRLQGLVGTSYAPAFLTELPHNAALMAAAEGYGLVPEQIRRVLERGAQ